MPDSPTIEWKCVCREQCGWVPGEAPFAVLPPVHNHSREFGFRQQRSVRPLTPSMAWQFPLSKAIFSSPPALPVSRRGHAGPASGDVVLAPVDRSLMVVPRGGEMPWAVRAPG